MAAMLTSQGEWLARRTTRYQVNLTTYQRIIESSHITIKKRQFRQWELVALLIFANSIAAITILFDDGGGLESRPTDAHGESTSASE